MRLVGQPVDRRITAATTMGSFSCPTSGTADSKFPNSRLGREVDNVGHQLQVLFPQHTDVLVLIEQISDVYEQV
jgi:hypothetical protein